MKTDETRIYDNQETSFMPENESTDSTLLDENTRVEDDVKLESATKKEGMSKAAQRAAFGAGGFVAGGVAGAGISAMASSTPDKDLSKAATPDDEKTDEELAQADPNVDDPSKAPEPEAEPEVKIIEEEPAAGASHSAANNGRATLLNPETHDAPVHSAEPANSDVNLIDDPAVVTPEMPQTAEAQPMQVNVTININGREVEKPIEVTPEPEVEVSAVGQLMDAEGNVINLAQVSVDGVEATMVDVDNDGSVDVALVDADGDGEITAEEVVDMTDTDLTMDDIAMHMMQQDDMNDQLALNNQTDFDPNADVDF